MGNRAESALCERLDSIDGLQEQHTLLQVRGELKERQELRDTGPGHPEAASSIRLIAELPLADERLDDVCEREHDRDARVPPDRGAHGRGSIGKPAAVTALDAMQCSRDDDGHRAPSSASAVTRSV